MEQIALFVLPGSSDEAEDNDEGPDSGGCDDRDQSEPSTIDHPGIARRYDNDGTTFLHKAAHNGDVELARSLLEKGADPIAQSKSPSMISILSVIASCCTQGPSSNC